MSKELRIFPHVTKRCIKDAEGTLRVARELDDFARWKHFTDAELAADYYRTAWLYECSIQDNDGYDGTRETRQLRRQTLVLDRFATRPHALGEA